MSNNYKDEQYELYELREEGLDPNPFKQFGVWYGAALKADLILPDAFTLATSGTDKGPSARMLLLKGFDENGFVFYTNSQSRKGDDLRDNPNAAICFWWGKLERQIRIEGRVERVDDSEADSYFATRPKGSQIGAWASEQSCVIDGRGALENRYREIEKEYEGRNIPRPLHWLGYVLIPSSIEFWQGRTDRLHDRLRYRLLPEGTWLIERLAP